MTMPTLPLHGRPAEESDNKPALHTRSTDLHSLKTHVTTPTTPPMASMSYDQSGVRYDSRDAFRRLCQQQAATTTAALAAHGFNEPASIRGDSAYLIETPDSFL